MLRLLSRIVSLVAGLATIATASASAAAEPVNLACVLARAEAPYRGSGYDHIVKLESRCEKPVQCRVSSDVNPDPVNVAVPPKGRIEVLLWRGSPASTFKARVTCT
jgi:hypothetical protein